jgi:fucose 4-O-acetylase-like acetyltransferase
MIIGHVPIDSGLRNFIYSFHMMAFVMASGYFYKSGLPLWENLKKTFKLLGHYALFAVLYLLFSSYTLPVKIQNLILGISYTKALLPDALTIGPVYFILLLFVVRLLYVFVDLIRSEWLKNFVVLALVTVGILLGKHGYWLPWTFDGALVSLLFYHIAHYIKQYDLLKKATKSAYIYFPLSCLWAFLVYMGGMEIAVRKYGNFGIVVAGNIAAFFVAYLLCHYLANHLPRWISITLAWVGQSTAYILIIHAVCGSKFRDFATHILGLNPNNIFNLAFTIAGQVAAGTLCCLMITYGKKLLKPKCRQP